MTPTIPGLDGNVMYKHFIDLLNAEIGTERVVELLSQAYDMAIKPSCTGTTEKFLKASNMKCKICNSNHSTTDCCAANYGKREQVPFDCYD